MCRSSYLWLYLFVLNDGLFPGLDAATQVLSRDWLTGSALPVESAEAGSDAVASSISTSVLAEVVDDGWLLESVESSGTTTVDLCLKRSRTFTVSINQLTGKSLYRTPARLYLYLYMG